MTPQNGPVTLWVDNDLEFPRNSLRKLFDDRSPVTICRLGDPVAWARTQHARGGKLFTPAKQRNVAAELHILAQQEMQGRLPMTGAVLLEMLAEFAIPSSWSKRRQAAAMGAPCPAYQDWDNLGKLVSDALNGVVYKDDRQVADARIRKRYGAQPKVIITVRGVST